MLRQCKWEGKEVNCSEIFTPVITDTGVCCAFNLQSDFKDSNYTSLVKDIQVRSMFDFYITLFRPKQGLLREMKSETFIQDLTGGLRSSLIATLISNSSILKYIFLKCFELLWEELLNECFNIHFRVSNGSVFTKNGGFRLFLGQNHEFPVMQVLRYFLCSALLFYNHFKY